MGKVINKLFNALHKERSSQETGVSHFGTHNLMNFLGSYHGVLSVFVISCLAWFAIIMLVSCGSSKNISSEKVNEKETVKEKQNSSEQTSSTSAVERTKSASDSVNSSTECKEGSSENSETITITETTIYDTNDTTDDTKPKVKKKIVQTKIERRGASKEVAQKVITNKTSVEVSKEKENKEAQSQNSSSATIDKRKKTECSTDKKQSVSESKQTLYIALTSFGIALVILASVLARWVFSKYRRQSQSFKCSMF